MNRKHARIIGGMFAAALAASATVLGFSACVNAADDCRNTRTCDPPPCNMDAGNDGSPLDGVDSRCCLQEDGGEVCAD
jgi:hypothetical protein